MVQERVGCLGCLSGTVLGFGGSLVFVVAVPVAIVGFVVGWTELGFVGVVAAVVGLVAAIVGVFLAVAGTKDA